MGSWSRKLVRGKIKVEIEGYNIERFYNISAQRALSVTDIHKDSESCLFWTTPEDFKNMKSIAKKTGVRLRVRGRYGLPFFLFRNRRRKLLASGFLLFFLFLYSMSFFIWDISFEGNHRFTDEMLLNYMKSLSLDYGIRKSGISCEELEAGIRNTFTEITWVSAEIKGTRLIVRVKENEVLSAPIQVSTEPCDLVAKKEGEIVRIVMRNGVSQVKIGDSVEEGALLVDGTVPIFDDSETLVNRHEVHSEAEIYAKTQYMFEVDVPAVHEEKSRTGRIRRGYYCNLFGKSLYIMFPEYGDFQWEFYQDQEQLRLLKDFYLPVYYGSLTAYEYVPYEVVYSEQEVQELCDRYLLESVEKLSEKGIQILGSDGKIERSESEWSIEGTIQVIEDIAVEVPISDKQEEAY